jgi:5-methylcytosine-specific restriction endonuclease McrA
MPVRPPTFRPKGQRSRREVNTDYDDRRGTAHERGYTYRLRQRMAAWKRGHPLCLGCQAIGRVTATEVTDHTIPHKGDKVLLEDEANWQPACRPHHDIVKQRLEALFKAGSIGVDALRLDSDRAIQMTMELL